MSRIRTFTISLVAAATIMLSFATGTPAWAGGDPNGTPPAPIVAPAGFASAYALEQAIVANTCNLEGTNQPAFEASLRFYALVEAAVDRALAAAGQPASPEYRTWSNNPAATPNCPRG